MLIDEVLRGVPPFVAVSRLPHYWRNDTHFLFNFYLVAAKGLHWEGGCQP